jgi:uncharacterized iron-regulated protein
MSPPAAFVPGEGPDAGVARARRAPSRARGVAAVIAAAIAVAACAGPGRPTAPQAASVETLLQAFDGASIVLLGEVHDHLTQHAMRAEALRRRVAGGASPALAFEPFDRERQADVERARRERPRDADWLIAQAGDPRAGWDWPLYRPYVQLALDHDLPIVAANLSRADASRVVREGWPALFDDAARAARGLDALPAAFVGAHERAIADGHCGLLPADLVPRMVRAQIARDIVLAQAVAAHAGRGVVLIAGNGHVRTDIGVPHWLAPPLRERTRAIGLLERAADGTAPDATLVGSFDRVLLFDPQPRPDPCAGFKPPAPGTGGRTPPDAAAPRR